MTINVNQRIQWSPVRQWKDENENNVQLTLFNELQEKPVTEERRQPPTMSLLLAIDLTEFGQPKQMLEWFRAIVTEKSAWI